MSLRAVLNRSVFVGFILALFVGAVAIAQVSDPRKRVSLTPDAAVSTVRGFAPDAKLTASGPFNGKNQLYFSVEGDELSANVDAFDGTIRTLTVRRDFPASSAVAVDASQAGRLAMGFVDAHHFGHSNVEPKVSLIDHGTFKEYLVEWQSRVNGALVPDYESVSINPQTGAVFGYTNFTRDYAAPPTPSIDQVAAQEIAKSQFESAGGWRTESAELRVDFDDAGVQRLVWLITLADGLSVTVVQVDAMTGSAEVVARG